jgi:uncharacterized membrane protein
MTSTPSPNDDRGFESSLGRLLGIGVLASTACLAVGLLLTLLRPADGPQRAFLTTGLLLLMATPIARVAVSAVTYARRRDWVFAALTAIVLLELFASVAAALFAPEHLV